ncbi:MAG: Ig-like domain-containing protein [Fibrobacterales bacterium]
MVSVFQIYIILVCTLLMFCSRTENTLGVDEPSEVSGEVLDGTVESLKDTILILEEQKARAIDSLVVATYDIEIARIQGQVINITRAEAYEEQSSLSIARSNFAYLQAQGAVGDTLLQAKDLVSQLESLSDSLQRELESLIEQYGDTGLKDPSHTISSSGASPLSASSQEREDGTSVTEGQSSNQSPGLSFSSLNTPPVIDQGEEVTITISEDGVPNAFELVLSVTDVEQIEWTWSVVIDPSLGVLSLNEEGGQVLVGYQPAPNHSGIVDFAIAVSDAELSDTIYISVTIEPVNDMPEYEGEASLTGSAIENQLLTVEQGTSCTDSVDGGILPIVSYAWYKDSNAVGNDGLALVFSNKQKPLYTEDVGFYFYAIVACTDTHGFAVYDTTAYSEKVLVAPPGTGPRALHFTKEDNYIALPEIALDVSNGYSFEALVFWDKNSPSQDGTLFEFSDTSGLNKFVLKRSKDILLFIASMGAGESQLKSQKGFVEEGHWTHVAITVENDGTARLYKNGYEDASASIAIMTNNAPRTKNFIGNSAEANNAHFGLLDNMHIWEKVLSVTELRKNLTRQVKGTELGLKAAWNFNSIDGKTLFDIGRTYDGELTHMTESQWVDSYEVKTVTVESPEGGVVNVSGAISVVKTMKLPITIEAKKAYSFSKWSVTSGIAHIGDASKKSTWVTVSDEDAVISAELHLDTIHVEFEEYFDSQPEPRSLIYEEGHGSIGNMNDDYQRLYFTRYLGAGKYRIRVQYSSWEHFFQTKIQFWFGKQGQQLGFPEHQRCELTENTQGYYNWTVGDDGEIIVSESSEYLIVVEFWRKNYNVDWFEFIPVVE